MNQRNGYRFAWLACCVIPMLAVGAALKGTSSQDRTDGLKMALAQAVDVAVRSLGQTDGFLGNPEVRIPLPGKLESARKTLRRLGLSKDVDQLATAMNRAAEAAVPEARVLLAGAIRQMSIKDAATILTGPEDAATQYFKGAMSPALTERFLPVVSRATADVKLAKSYDSIAKKAGSLGLIDPQDANLDSYVTRLALEGLFKTMAKEEVAIRRNPAGQASALLRKVFGAIVGK